MRIVELDDFTTFDNGHRVYQVFPIGEDVSLLDTTRAENDSEHRGHSHQTTILLKTMPT